MPSDELRLYRFSPGVCDSAHRLYRATCGSGSLSRLDFVYYALDCALFPGPCPSRTFTVTGRDDER